MTAITDVFEVIVTREHFERAREDYQAGSLHSNTCAIWQAVRDKFPDKETFFVSGSYLVHYVSGCILGYYDLSPNSRPVILGSDLYSESGMPVTIDLPV